MLLEEHRANIPDLGSGHRAHFQTRNSSAEIGMVSKGQPPAAGVCGLRHLPYSYLLPSVGVGRLGQLRRQGLGTVFVLCDTSVHSDIFLGKSLHFLG